MLPKKVVISNFRSIKDGVFFFDPSCRGLVGKTESGKSNLLKAISYFNPNKTFDELDVRQISPEERNDADSKIVFYFCPDQRQCKDFLQSVKEKLLVLGEDSFLEVDGVKTSLWKVCKDLSKEFTYVVNLTRKERKIIPARNVKFSSVRLLEVSSETPKDFSFSLGEWKSVTLLNYSFLESLKLTPEVEKYLKQTDKDGFGRWLQKQLEDFFYKEFPRCVYWSYDELKTLPDNIRIEDFVNEPDKFPYLKNMFIYSGYKNVREEFERAKERGSKGVFNLLNGISTKVTNHFHKIWPEYKHIAFKLWPGGQDIIEIAIEEKNRWDFKQRSDGLKKFVSFLLEVSVVLNTNEGKEAILLLDEPGKGLHPSAEKFLLKELIKLSERHLVIYSTHSPSMIDRDNVKRHLIVNKKEEVTSLVPVEESRISDEEVLYYALGYSMFDSLKRDNFLFEGWKDKELFKKAIESIHPKISRMKGVFQGIGLCHAKGVSDVSNITPLLELANRRNIIISDSDEAAVRSQKDFKENQGYGEWIRYDECARPGHMSPGYRKLVR